MIPPEDLRITCENPHLGGQQVGTLLTMIVEHIPSGIKVVIPAGIRSQHRQRMIATDAILGAITSPAYRSW